jgi:hypothetical protein
MNTRTRPNQPVSDDAGIAFAAWFHLDIVW